MKKLLFFFIFWIFFIPLEAIAQEESSSCPIMSNSADEINDYITNIRTLITNVNNQLSENTPSSSKFENTTSDIWRLLNQAVTWDWYFLDFDYYIISPLFDELPSQMKRDVELLESETQGLRKYLKTITKSGYANIQLTSEWICNWVENCELKWSASSVIWDIIINNITVTNYLKEILVSQSDSYSTQATLLPNDSTTFTQALVRNYWTDARTQCAFDDGEFWARISAAIDNITLNNQQGEEWIALWRDSWKLLVWAVKWETDESLEIELLSKELARQWLSTNQQEILINNLKEFNNNDFYSLENNFITKLWKSIQASGVKIRDWFSKAFEWVFDSEQNEEINLEKSIWLTDFNTLNENEVITENIKENIDYIYNLQNSFLAIEDYQTNSIIWELIDIHSNIKTSSQTLLKKCELAVKVCNSQGYWEWYCGSCN